MDIKLNWIKAKNLKGIKNYTLVLNGKDARVIANNGKCKTTLFDCFLWLFFNKDSAGRDGKTAKIKPQDENGKDIHHLQTEVEAELILDSKNLLKIKKMQEEKWTKRRGAEKKELTGNTIFYWWNEVPVKESEFKQKVSELIDETILKMVTDPFYFNTQVKWQDRRNILLQICGDATDEQVIDSDNRLIKLKNVLSQYTFEDYKKVLSDKLKRLRKEKADIPPRIDELRMGLPQVEEDYSEVENQIYQHKNALVEIDSKMTDANKIVEDFRKKQQELYGLKNKLEKIKTRIDSEANVGRKKLFEEKSELENGKYTLESSIDLLKRKITENEQAIKENSTEKDKLLDRYHELKATQEDELRLEFVEMDYEEEFICPTCGQDLPSESKESKVEEMRQNFKNEKQRKLDLMAKQIESNISTGKNLKLRIETAEKAVRDFNAELEQKRESLLKIVRRINEIEKELQKPAETPDYNADIEYQELSSQISKLQAEVDKPIEDTTTELRTEKQNIQSKIDSLNAILNSKDRVEKDKKRIEELKAEEKRISSLITELEGHEYLLERFTVAKVNLLEDKINSHFKSVRFKMFDENISNSGIQECCEAMVNTNGSYVPFADANLAGKVNAGLDCIVALGKYYGFTAPIWIDNRESVSEIIETDSQVINLIKPPTWDDLDKSTQCGIAGVEEKEQLTIGDMDKIESSKKAWNDRNNSLRVEVE